MFPLILNKKEIGQLALLTFLLRQNDPVSKVSLLKQFQISPSTLKRYTFSLNMDLQSLKEFNHIQIADKNGCYYLDNPSPFAGQYVLKKINWYYHTTSLSFQLFQKLFSNSIPSLSNLQTSLSISSPYLYKLLSDANLFLKPFHIEIDYSRNLNNIVLTGHGTNILLFKIYFFWSVNQGISWPFEYITKDEIYSKFTKEELKILFSTSQSKQLKYIYSLAVIHNHYLSDELELQLIPIFKETFSIFQSVYDLSRPLKRLLSENYVKKTVKNLDDECLFFNYMIRVYGSFKDSEELQIEIGKNLFSLNNELITYCKQMIDELIFTFPEFKDLPNYYDLRCQILYFFSLYFSTIFYIQFDSSNLQEFMIINPDIDIIHPESIKKSKEFFDTFIKNNPLINSIIISDFHLTLAYGLIYYFTSKIPSSPLFIYIYFSKNLFGEFYFEAELYKLFGRENIQIIPKIQEADIVISDFYEERYKTENYFYFDDVTNREQWKKLIVFVHDYQLSMLN